MGHLVCCEYAGTRHSELVCGWLFWGLWGGGSLTCSGQTRPLVFHLLGRILKFPRGCLRSPWGRRSGVLSRLGDLPSKRTAPLQLSYISGFRVRFFFALRGLLLKKESWKTTDQTISSKWEPLLPQVWGRLFPRPPTTDRLALIVFLEPVADRGGRDHGQLPKSPARRPSHLGGRRGCFLKGKRAWADFQRYSLDGTTEGSFDMSCPSQPEREWKPQRLLSGKTRDSLLEPYSSLGLALGQDG